MSKGDIPVRPGRHRATRLRPLDLGDVLDGMFQLPVRHWRPFTIALGVITVPVVLLSSVANGVVLGATPSLQDVLADPQVGEDFLLGEPTNLDLATLLATFGMVLIVTALTTPLRWGVALDVAAAAHRHGTADAGASLRRVGSRYLPLLGVTVLLSLIALVVGVVPLVTVVPLLVGGAAAAGGTAGTVLAVALGVLGVVGVLVVFAVVMARLQLAVAVVLLERAGPVQALVRSNALVRGRTGGMLGRAVGVLLLSNIVTGVLGLPFGLLGLTIGGVVGLVGGAAAVANAAMAALGGIITGIIGDALRGAAFALLYHDRRVRVEGLDLAEMADELAAQPQPAVE